MHTIRLHSAWHLVSQENGNSKVFLRRFHKPTGLGHGESSEQVWLAVDCLPEQSSLNGESLVWDEPSRRVNITMQLQQSNELRFQLGSEADLKTVRLEIEA